MSRFWFWMMGRKWFPYGPGWVLLIAVNALIDWRPREWPVFVIATIGVAVCLVMMVADAVGSDGRAERRKGRG